MGVLDKFDHASQSTDTVTLILDKALDAQWRQLHEDLVEAAKQDEQRGSLAASATRKVIDQLEDIRDQVKASEVRFDFHQMDPFDYLELQAAHPPRKGVLLDRLQGYDSKTFPLALIKQTCTSVTDTDGDTATEIPDAKWKSLLGSLNLAQMDKLFTAAKGVNLGETSVPPSARSLLGSQDSGASLAQPSPGKDRPRKGSAGGSRRTSPKSSATKKAESSAT